MKELLRKLSNFFNLTEENRMAHMAPGNLESAKPIEAAKEAAEGAEVDAESLDKGVKKVESTGDATVDAARRQEVLSAIEGKGLLGTIEEAKAGKHGEAAQEVFSNSLDRVVADAKEYMTDDLARQLETKLNQAGAKQMDKEAFDNLMDQVNDIIDDYTDNAGEDERSAGRAARKAIGNLHVDTELRTAVADMGILKTINEAEEGSAVADVMGEKKDDTRLVGRARPPRPSER